MRLSNVGGREIPGHAGGLASKLVHELTVAGPDIKNAVTSRQAAVRRVEEVVSLQSKSIEAEHKSAVRKAQDAYLETVAQPERDRIATAYEEAITEAERDFTEVVSLADGYFKAVQAGRQGRFDEIKTRHEAAYETARLQREAAIRTAYNNQNKAWHEAQVTYDAVKDDPKSSSSEKGRAHNRMLGKQDRAHDKRNRMIEGDGIFSSRKKKEREENTADNKAAAERKQVDADITAASRECEQIKSEAKKIKEAAVKAAGITKKGDVARLESRLRKLRKQLPQMDLDDMDPEQAALKLALEEAEAARRDAMGNLIAQKSQAIGTVDKAYDAAMGKIDTERSQNAEAPVTVGEVSEAFLNAGQQEALNALHKAGIAITISGQVLKAGAQAGALTVVEAALVVGMGAIVSPVLVASLPVVPLILGTGAVATLVVGGYRYAVENR